MLYISLKSVRNIGVGCVVVGYCVDLFGGAPVRTAAHGRADALYSTISRLIRQIKDPAISHITHGTPRREQ